MLVKRIQCPCCGYYTVIDMGTIITEICPVCYWQYDEVGHDDPDRAVGGPNYELSLNQARENFKKFGASSMSVKDYVRDPILPKELYPHEEII